MHTHLCISLNGGLEYVIRRRFLPMQIKYILGIILSISVFVVGCDSAPSPEDISSSVVLENQSDHSGIMVDLVGTPSFQITGATGSIGTFDVPDGEYTFSLLYPYFLPDTIVHAIENGIPSPPFSIELVQAFAFRVQPDSAVVPLSNNQAVFSTSVKNVSTDSRQIGSYSSHWPYGVTMTNGEWPNEYCQGNAMIQVTAQGQPMLGSIGPGAEYSRSPTFEFWTYFLNQVGCLSAGEYYLFYAPTDALAGARRYFSSIGDSLLTPEQALELNLSLYRKHELFHPALVRITN